MPRKPKTPTRAQLTQIAKMEVLYDGSIFMVLARPLTIDALGLKPGTLKLLATNPYIPRDVAALADLSDAQLLKQRGFGWMKLLDLTLCLQRHGYERNETMARLRRWSTPPYEGSYYQQMGSALHRRMKEAGVLE